MSNASVSQYKRTNADGSVDYFVGNPGRWESKRESIERLITLGSIDPNCPECQSGIMAADHPLTYFGPNHKISYYCASGRKPHCTCPTCWG